MHVKSVKFQELHHRPNTNLQTEYVEMKVNVIGDSELLRDSGFTWSMIQHSMSILHDGECVRVCGWIDSKNFQN